MALELTAKGRYYKVYVNGQYLSQHTTEREAIQRCSEVFSNAQANGDPKPVVHYVHEYDVEVDDMLFVSKKESPSQDSSPFDLSGYDMSHFQTGAISWPTAPTTDHTTNVSTIGQFQTAVADSNVRIVVGSGLSLTGNLDITGSDIDIVMPNDSTLNGYVKMEPGGGNFVDRVRWTGGNIDTGGVTAIGNYAWTGVHDILFKDVSLIGAVYLNRDFSTKRATQRVAFVECTIDGRSSTQDFTMYQQNDTTAHTDLIMANCKVYNANLSNSVVRFQDVTRSVFVETYFNPGYQFNVSGAVTGFRLSNECEDMLMAGTVSKPVIVAGLIHFSNGGNYGVADARFDNIERYLNFQQFCLAGIADTGTIGTMEFYDEGGPRALSGLSGFTYADAANTIDWDGVTLPAHSSYGAQR